MIGEAARRTGLTMRAVRLYEAQGLVTPRRDDADVRFYDREALSRLEHIAFLRRCGFSLKEIAGVLATGDRHGADALRRRTADILSRRLSQLDAQRDEMRKTLAALTEDQPAAVA